MTAGDEEGLAGDPARIFGGKKDGDGTDVVGLTDAAQRRLRFHGFVKIRSGDAGGMKAFRFDHAGVQRIHADPARPEFFRERIPPSSDASTQRGGCRSKHEALLLRCLRFLQQQCLHVRNHEAGIERAGTVDVPDAGVAID